jgi:hypothetical protein
MLDMARVNALRAVLKETWKQADTYGKFMSRVSQKDPEATPANEPPPIANSATESIEKEVNIIAAGAGITTHEQHLWEPERTFMDKWATNTGAPRNKSAEGLADYYRGVAAWLDKTDKYLIYLTNK